MPLIVEPGGVTSPSTAESLLGAPPPPPRSNPAPATVSSSQPTVSTSPIPGQGIALDVSGKLPVSIQVQAVPITTADPTSPVIGQIWYRQDTSQLCIRHDAGTTKRVTFA